MPLAALCVATLANARAHIPAIDSPPVASAYLADKARIMPAPDRHAEPASVADPIRRSGDGMFYLTAPVNDRPVRFLIDTGASMVVLTRADASAIGLRIDEKDMRHLVRTAGGNARMAIVQLDSVKLGRRDLTGLDAAIVEDGVGVSLLGQNALSRLQSISIEGDHLTLR